MHLTVSRWPFDPPNLRLPEDNERWWDECYLPHAVQNLLETRARWCILLGAYQSGKSTALDALRRKMEGIALVIEDDSLVKQDAPEGNILHRILSRASLTLRQNLIEAPAKISLLSQTQLEFLRWSVEKFHGHRAFMRWLDGLPQEFSQSLYAIPFEDLYPSPTSDVQGQIEELTNLSARLGYQQTLALIDCPPFPTTEQEQEIQHILGWLEPMQHKLKGIMALPPHYTPQKIKELCRGRADVFELEPDFNYNREVISRHLTAATDGAIQKLEQIGSPKLISQLRNFIQDEFYAPAIGAWIKVIDIILHEMRAEASFPLTIDSLPKIISSYYSRFASLRLGPAHANLGVWRGYKWIPLDRALYEFLVLLIRYKGKHITHEIAQTSKGNLHTLARRLRVAIEPDPTYPIFLHNSKGEGYWIEKNVL
ncbi:MAG: hypothetical protein M5U11_16100 [Anaerolineales bacterium]|nr:hypothetical protein [Anaerolineales bacterium]MDX9936063.1 hypothetical protein [Anaerolineales bacterium]GER79437.1 conserved hypothetical protein [Candidatus Denitrolinea symbiosum]